MHRRSMLASIGLLLLCMLTACGTGKGTMPTHTLVVHVTETDFHITSSVNTFLTGITYRFVVTNQGPSMHELMLMPKSEGDMAGMPMANMDKQALVSLPMLHPGQTQTFTYTFPASAAGSHPELACYLPGHYAAGMRLDLVVQ